MSYYYYNYDEQMDDGEMDYDTIFEENQPIYSWENTFETCIMPSTLQILRYMSILIGWSIIGRLALAVFSRIQTKNDWLLHIISTLAGSSVLIITMGKNSFILFFVAGISYMILHILHQFAACRKNIGVIMVIFTLSAQIGSELIWKQVSWQIIKGSIMVTNMKIISVAFEMGYCALNSRQTVIVPNIFSFFGYIFMPATLIIGPWVPYSSYLYSIRPNPSPRIHMQWIIWCSLCSVLSLCFVNLSNCIVPLIFANNTPIWMRIFRDAFAVRCSHYFVSFLSQASIAAGGISLNMDIKPNAWLGHMVTEPLQIEFPRSLSTVVRKWNIPMHTFLKEHIFRGIYKRYDSQLLAIFVTYLVSSLLHGEYVKIYLVLISLAGFSCVEYTLRAKLANAFNACITANNCRKLCRFKYCPSHGWLRDGSILVKVANLLFSILAIFHLAYLGAIMNESTMEEDVPEVRSFVDLTTWSIVSFLNHWIALLTYLLYLII
ncbi:protein-serine O-palmitoleoyltransferase porcupine [Anastrepha ludens]|uniref:protein-serine O-palmitoleoyltransferase porcupine n=1 Tax=Anastrepha ludens TaxID=28586 RepID=UPI0023B08619|nr:protein-serine O-palmitoleoyltransferase porcupine [Anastrepha ludens]